ncbi:MAG: hypothetical protein ISQ15_09915 [Ilumatobacteraceae bacterium]|nr:hypothetical protein [Ilumatobacteraceae bacterium]
MKRLDDLLRDMAKFRLLEVKLSDPWCADRIAQAPPSLVRGKRFDAANVLDYETHTRKAKADERRRTFQSKYQANRGLIGVRPQEVRGILRALTGKWKGWEDWEDLHDLVKLAVALIW